MIDWSGFIQKKEPDQAHILLDAASAAWVKQEQYHDIALEIRGYLKLGYEVLGGKYEKLPQLIRFLEDPEMKHDFGAFYERLQHGESASAALDLASYACGFVSRIAAKASGYSPLPDPVLESVPEIYEYYRARAESLGV